jgi:CheY-like chemotaxis protein
MSEVSCSEVNSIKLNQQQTNSRNIANVLVVDNDPDLIRFILEILAGRGILGHLANDKKEAIDFLEKNSCDLVFASNRINSCSVRRNQACRLCSNVRLKMA